MLLRLMQACRVSVGFDSSAGFVCKQLSTFGVKLHEINVFNTVKPMARLSVSFCEKRRA